MSGNRDRVPPPEYVRLVDAALRWFQSWEESPRSETHAEECANLRAAVRHYLALNPEKNT